MDDSVVAFKGEVMLAGWSESHNGGAKVTLFLQSPEELEPFRSMTVAKGKQAGQRFMCVLVEIGDDERPVKQHKGGSLTKLAGMFSQQERFWRWARLTDPVSWDRSAAIAMTEEPAEVAAEFIRLKCGITSRAELDSNSAAAHLFHDRIRIPYSKSLEG